MHQALGAGIMTVGTLMLRSLYEGYIPCIILAAIGFNTLGGSVLLWLSFVWVFGAVMTVGVACLRLRVVGAPSPAPQRVNRAMENY